MTAHVPLDRVLTAVRSVHRQKETAVSAPEPSVVEQAVIDRFEAAPEPPEITVEKVARALRDELQRLAYSDDLVAWPSDDDVTALATAALAALRGDRAPQTGEHTTGEDADRG